MLLFPTMQWSNIIPRKVLLLQPPIRFYSIRPQKLTWLNRRDWRSSPPPISGGSKSSGRAGRLWTAAVHNSSIVQNSVKTDQINSNFLHLKFLWKPIERKLDNAILIPISVTLVLSKFTFSITLHCPCDIFPHPRFSKRLTHNPWIPRSVIFLHQETSNSLLTKKKSLKITAKKTGEMCTWDYYKKFQWFLTKDNQLRRMKCSILANLEIWQRKFEN